jgi:hypothetical protein
MNTSRPAKTRTSPGTVAPIRIYVLWHPDFEDGEAIAYQIYRWFRLDSMEGIPVFFRSPDAPGQDTPPDVPDDCPLNYVVPLVEAHMVADPEWRAYVLGLTQRPNIRLFPVALDPLAFQMPAKLRRLNFIRYAPTASDPTSDVLLGQLTEILCRDLRGHETASTKAAAPASDQPVIPGKIKLFLSHAKADGTDVPVRLKEYIQTHTQCETFFDETDIASGHEYAKILEEAIRDESAGMIAIHGDHYAERPWCRREIRRFQQPWPEPESQETQRRAKAYFVPPLVVVQNMSGQHIARTIPELGQAPCLRWTDDAERRIVSTLLREILLGLFYRRLAREARMLHSRDTVLVNRAPDPVMTQHLLGHRASRSAPKVVLYPGYGLSQMEKDGLAESFPDVAFRSLSEDEKSASELQLLSGKVLRLGIGTATDILSGGLSDEHNRELLIRLLRPLCRHNVSLLYGGSLPKPGASIRVNFTEACLHLLLSERSSFGNPKERSARLYSVPAWPDSDTVTARTIAEWTDVCSFHPVRPSEAGLANPPDPLPVCLPDPEEFPTAAERRAHVATHSLAREATDLTRDVTRAQCLTFMRRQCCREISFPIADRERHEPKEATIRAFAHLFIGGRLEKNSGVAPGLFEEILYALEARQPVFLIGAGFGATGAVCRWLLEPPKELPFELRQEPYLQNAQVHRLHQELQKLASSGPSPSKPVTLTDVLAGLWEKVNEARGRHSLSGLLNNGLTDEENRTLLQPATGYGEICKLVWKGLVAVGRSKTRPIPVTNPPRSRAR